jgi:hypothetical protein
MTTAGAKRKLSDPAIKPPPVSYSPNFTGHGNMTDFSIFMYKSFRHTSLAQLFKLLQFLL